MLSQRQRRISKRLVGTFVCIAGALTVSLGAYAGSGGQRESGSSAKGVVGHFACYQTTFTTTKSRTVFLMNQFAQDRDVLTVQVLQAKQLCTPADKNKEGMLNPKAHLTCFQVRLTAGVHVAHTVQVDNQFGTVKLGLSDRPDSLCLPSAKAISGQGQPGNVPTTLGHYACYPVREVGDFKDGVKVSVRDQFGTFTGLVRKPMSLCLPTRKSLGQGKSFTQTLRPDVHLLCYLLETKAKSKTSIVRNQFGVQTAKAALRTRLCVPSSKKVIE